jgi:membrane-bound lytic murein transglycosylase B
MLDRGNNLVTKQIEVAEMIYELDKRQLLRLWSVLSSFGEIRETKDPIIQSQILRRAQLVLTDFVFGLKRVPEDQTSTTPLEGGRSQTVTFDA